MEALVNLVQPDKEWCDLHFRERVGGIPLNPGESYKVWPYANFTEGDNFLKEGMKFDHSYMERFWPKRANGGRVELGMRESYTYDNKGIYFNYGDYNDVITQLSDNPLTRQAYLPIFFPEDTGAIKNIRVPCTLGYLFEIFDGKLDITYYIRSCDVYRHLRNDVYLAAKLLIHTKNILLDNENLKDLECGKLNMKIANLHLFKNDIYPLIKREKRTNGRNS
jgi:thymidylate synthase